MNVYVIMECLDSIYDEDRTNVPIAVYSNWRKADARVRELQKSSCIASGV